MGKRKSEQAPLWIPTTELPVSPGHPFYVRLNEILDAAGFDRFVEEQCRPFYAPVMGRPSLAPGRYVRLLLIGYFEGLDSERGIAWRAADSLAVRSFVGLGLDVAAPDHSTISRTRRLIDVDTHRAVFMTILRDQLPESLTLFDFPDPNSVAGERATTNVPAQALALLNDPFVLQQADGWARRLVDRTHDSVAGRIETMFRTALGRSLSAPPRGCPAGRAGRSSGR